MKKKFAVVLSGIFTINICIADSGSSPTPGENYLIHWDNVLSENRLNESNASIQQFSIPHSNYSFESNMSPVKSGHRKSESGVIIKKGSLLIQNSDGSFKLKNGCYTKYDDSHQKIIESCVNN